MPGYPRGAAPPVVTHGRTPIGTPQCAWYNWWARGRSRATHGASGVW